MGLGLQLGLGLGLEGLAEVIGALEACVALWLGQPSLQKLLLNFKFGVRVKEFRRLPLPKFQKFSKFLFGFGRAGLDTTAPRDPLGVCGPCARLVAVLVHVEFQRSQKLLFNFKFGLGLRLIHVEFQSSQKLLRRAVRVRF